MAFLILDTTALIDWEKGKPTPIQSGDDVAIAAVTFAELQHGLLAADSRFQARRAEFIDDVKATIDILDYTANTAAQHAVLLDYVRRTGTQRGAHDLIIAAHARQTGRHIVSRDGKAKFGELPGVTLSE